jgi:periplasmic divalent cation tolerance protein
MDEYVVVLITAPSIETGKALARAILDARLAACVNILPAVNSMYVWEGEIYDEGEVLLIVKTRANLLDGGLIPIVEKLHPYKTPEIIALPIVKGARKYLEWVGEVTS